MEKALPHPGEFFLQNRKRLKEISFSLYFTYSKKIFTSQRNSTVSALRFYPKRDAAWA